MDNIIKLLNSLIEEIHKFQHTDAKLEETKVLAELKHELDCLLFKLNRFNREGRW